MQFSVIGLVVQRCLLRNAYVAFIKRIKRKFKKAIYGKTIVKTQQVVMNRNTIEAMTKVTNNKNVNFGG